MSIVRRKSFSRDEWIKVLLISDASVLCNDVLGIVVDFVLIHLFQKKDGGLSVYAGGVTCTLPFSRPEPVWHENDRLGWSHWLFCTTSGPPITWDDEFSVVIHDALPVSPDRADIRWPVLVGVSISDQDTIALFGDNEIGLISSGSSSDIEFYQPMRVLQNGGSWGANTIITVKVTGGVGVRFSINGEFTETYLLSRCMGLTADCSRWKPMVGLRRGQFLYNFHCSNNSFLHSPNSISLI